MSDVTPDFPVVVNDSGPGTDGTIFNKAFFDAILAAINNQVLSATNPTLTPKAIIDEVVTARGSKANLNARLSTSMDADGNITSLVTATELVAGILSVAAQNIGGVKTFYAHPEFRPGTATTAAKVSGRITTVVTPASNAGAGNTDLMAYSVPANVLDTNGKAVRITVWGVFNTNANVKTLQLFVYGSNVATIHSAGTNGHSWKYVIDVVRISATQIRWAYHGLTSAAGGASYNPSAAEGVLTVDPTSANSSKLMGQGSVSSDITQNVMLVEIVG